MFGNDAFHMHMSILLKTLPLRKEHKTNKRLGISAAYRISLIPPIFFAVPPCRTPRKIQPEVSQILRQVSLIALHHHGLSLQSVTPRLGPMCYFLAYISCCHSLHSFAVCSAKKPEKNPDHFHRVVQQHAVENPTQRVMYCKDKIYTGVEEFLL